MTEILLVEDDAMIASGIKYALEMEGFKPTHVTNVNDALLYFIIQLFLIFFRTL